jgi:hypothetical protein
MLRDVEAFEENSVSPAVDGNTKGLIETVLRPSGRSPFGSLVLVLRSSQGTVGAGGGR